MEAILTGNPTEDKVHGMEAMCGVGRGMGVACSNTKNSVVPLSFNWDKKLMPDSSPVTSEKSPKEND